MSKREKIVAALKLAEDDFAANQLHFHLLESIILDQTLRTKLLKKEDLHKRFTEIYAKSINAVCAQLTDISRYRFLAINKNEIAHISDSTNLPNYNLSVTNFNAVALTVQTDILLSDSMGHGVIALRRWIEITLQMVHTNDFSTALAIFGAIESTPLAKYSSHLNEKTKEQLTRLRRYFDPIGEYKTLRDLMIGQCIPDLCAFTGLLKKSAAEMVAENFTLRTTIQSALNSIYDMQNKCLAVTDLGSNPNPTFDDPVMFESQERLNQKLKEIAVQLEVKLSEKHGIEQRIEFLYQASESHCSKSPITGDFSGEHSFCDHLFSKIPSKLTDAQKQYEQVIYDLRKYAQTIPKEGTPSYRRKSMFDFLHNLSLNSNIRKKIELINELIMKNNVFIERCTPVEQQKMTLNPQVILYLKKLITILETRDKLEAINTALVKAIHDIEMNKPQRSPKENTGVRFRNRYTIVHDSLPKEIVPTLDLNKVDTKEKKTKSAKQQIDSLALAAKLLDSKPLAPKDTIELADKNATLKGSPKEIKRQADSPLRYTDKDPITLNLQSNSRPASPSRLVKTSPKGSSVVLRRGSRASTPSIPISPSYSPCEPGTPIHSPLHSPKLPIFDDGLNLEGSESNDNSSIKSLSGCPSPQDSPHSSSEDLARPHKPFIFDQRPLPKSVQLIRSSSGGSPGGSQLNLSNQPSETSSPTSSPKSPIQAEAAESTPPSTPTSNSKSDDVTSTGYINLPPNTALPEPKSDSPQSRRERQSLSKSDLLAFSMLARGRANLADALRESDSSVEGNNSKPT